VRARVCVCAHEKVCVCARNVCCDVNCVRLAHVCRWALSTARLRSQNHTSSAAAPPAESHGAAAETVPGDERAPSPASPSSVASSDAGGQLEHAPRRYRRRHCAVVRAATTDADQCACLFVCLFVCVCALRRSTFVLRYFLPLFFLSWRCCSVVFCFVLLCSMLCCCVVCCCVVLDSRRGAGHHQL